MNRRITIRIDKNLDGLLTRVAETSGRPRSDVAREALRRHLKLAMLDSVRARVAPHARAQGLVTDEDVFAEIS